MVRMNELDIAAATCLGKCIFLPGSYNKRFAWSMRNIALSDQPELTEKQYANLWRLAWRYRRQIVALADGQRVVAEAQKRYDARTPAPDCIKWYWVEQERP